MVTPIYNIVHVAFFLGACACMQSCCSYSIKAASFVVIKSHFPTECQLCRIPTHENYMECIEDIDGDCVSDSEVNNYCMHLLDQN